jgi:hypothetical protein
MKKLLFVLLLILFFVGFYFSDVFSFKVKVDNQVRKIEYYIASKSITQIQINIKEKEFKQLLYQRDTLIKRGNIFWGVNTKEGKLKVKAKFKSNNNRSKGKISIAGHYWDHWKRDPFSIKAKVQTPINGSLNFNLLNSETRGHMTDWFAHKLEKELGLRGLESEYVLVDFNGEEKLYLFEGLYDSEFLKRHNLTDAIFVKEYSYKNSEGKVLDFSNKTVNSEAEKVFSNLFNQLINNQLNIENVVDFEKMAKFYALGELFQSTHQLFHFNLRYIFNNKTGKLEPVGREYWLADKGRNRSLFLNSHLLDKSLEYGRIPALLFKNEKFVKLYNQELKKVSEPAFLDKYLLKYEDNFEKGRTLLWNDFPWVSEPLNFKVLFENRVWLENETRNLD